MPTEPLFPIFDLDGTLLDSDAALVRAFVALGVPAEEVTFGHVIGEECERLGLTVAAYAAVYDTGAAQPFPGVPEVLAELGHWAVCSNKHKGSGRAELERLGWHPDVAFFTEDFPGPKRLAPVLDRLGLDPQRALYVGDSPHDLACARAARVRFALAGWNPRSAGTEADVVLADPQSLLRMDLYIHPQVGVRLPAG